MARFEPQDWPEGREPDPNPPLPEKPRKSGRTGWVAGLMLIAGIWAVGALSVLGGQWLVEFVRRCW